MPLCGRVFIERNQEVELDCQTKQEKRVRGSRGLCAPFPEPNTLLGLEKDLMGPLRPVWVVVGK